MSSDEAYDSAESEETTQLDFSNPAVVTKFRTCGDIANEALAKVISACKAGAVIAEVCALGDSVIVAKCANYNKNNTKMDKGIAFPTCISVNNVVGHFSPVESETRTLQEGDVVKIDLGVHIDGYPCVVGHTLVVASEGDERTVTSGRKADVILAAYYALEAGLRLVKAGNVTTQLTELITSVAETFGVRVVRGVMSHNMKRFLIDGDKSILSIEDPEAKVEAKEFEVNDCIALDVVYSTGEGKPREENARTTVFKRAVDVNYKLKMKASRAVLSEVNEKFAVFPFTVRALEQKKSNFGIIECVKHGLLEPYPVLLEKDDEYVAQMKSTVLVTTNGLIRLSTSNTDLSLYSSEVKIDDNIKTLIAKPLKKKKKKKKAKKAVAVEGQ